MAKKLENREKSMKAKTSLLKRSIKLIISIKIFRRTFYIDIGKMILKLIWKGKRNGIVKIVCKRRITLQKSQYSMNQFNSLSCSS